MPKVKNIKPRYGQTSLSVENNDNELNLVVSPDKEGNVIWINQDAWLSMGDFIDDGEQGQYTLHHGDHGVYVFVIDGRVSIAGETLNKRDALGLTDLDKFIFTTHGLTKLLIIEVPMT